MTFRYSISNTLIFLLTFLLQVFVLLQVDVFGVGFPMIYFMAVLFMPVKQPAWWVLPLAFLCGFSVDFFTDTGGMHAAATVFTAFVRLFLLNRIEPQNGYAADDAPGSRGSPLSGCWPTCSPWFSCTTSPTSSSKTAGSGASGWSCSRRWQAACCRACSCFWSTCLFSEGK